ncbi:uncharacterized protein [Miscanthus floridulus]|uniref:uncharacterized protein n=1 Tax=Miscanthus floridulus TaxID=154761 RepID=UPI00345A1A43
MAMEPHSLRFVRCPKCHQLLVEYPSIPVYKCGGCGTVLRAKHRAAPAARAGSESGERSTSSPCSLKGSSIQSSGSICSGEQRADPSVDRPHGSVSSTVNNIDSCDGAVDERTISEADSGVTHAKHPKEDTCSLTDDGNIQNSEVMVKEKETHNEDAGAGSTSDLTETVENVDMGEKANGGKISDIGTSELSTTLYDKSQAAHREERPHMYEGVHVESHKALIEELERSLSFSSDDEYFSDKAESSGLSDALRNQMGSRRIRANDAPRSDPHGRLIEELEMSFSDAEEPLEQHGMGLGRVHGNVLDKDPQALGAKSEHPCEESLSSFDSGHLKSEQTSHQESRAIGNGNQGNERIEDNNNTANSVHGSEHIVIADDEIAERFHEKEHDKDFQPANTESAYPFEGSTSSVDDGSIEVKQSFQLNDLTADVNREMEDDKIANDNLVPADSLEKEHGNDNLVLVPAEEAETVCVNEELTADGTQEMEDGYMEDDETTNCVHRNDNSMLADENIAERVHRNEDLTTDGTQEMEEGCMEDGNMTNCIHVSDNLVFADEDTAEKVHGNEETADGAGENEESCMENENVNVAVADEDIAKKVHENEHGKDRQSLEDESAHLYEGVITSFAGYAKSEQSFQQDEPIPDATEEKEEDFMEDGNTASCIQENRAAVARFSSLPNKRNQSKLASFNKNKEQMTYRSRGSQLRQGQSLDSEDFHSIQNFMESQMDGTSSSPSSGSPSRGDLVHRTANKFNNNIRHVRLKKMDELRDQLSRLSSQKGSETSYQKRDLEYQQQSNSYDVEHHLQSVDGDSAPSSCALESYYGHGRPPRYPPPNPFSPTYTYTHCHFGHAQTRLPHNYDPWEFNSYYQPSYAESTILDHESLRSSYKEQKRVVRKHILRPLSGASPFTICNSCFNLVQMPSDIYISKAKVGKMQCGKCSKVLALSFPAVCNANAKSSVDVAQESYNLDDSVVAKNDDIASYYAECLTGGPVSISEDYGASYTRSLPTQAGSSSLAATKSGKKVSDSALHRLMGYDSASQLLRHSRVFEDGYESFESMVPVSSRVSRRKNK